MNIDEIRKSINEVDKDLLALLGKRFRLVEKIRAMKIEKLLMIEDKKREEKILHRLCKERKKWGLSRKLIEEIWAVIFCESKKIQQ